MATLTASPYPVCAPVGIELCPFVGAAHVAQTHPLHRTGYLGLLVAADLLVPTENLTYRYSGGKVHDGSDPCTYEASELRVRAGDLWGMVEDRTFDAVCACFRARLAPDAPYPALDWAAQVLGGPFGVVDDVNEASIGSRAVLRLHTLRYLMGLRVRGLPRHLLDTVRAAGRCEERLLVATAAYRIAYSAAAATACGDPHWFTDAGFEPGPLLTELTTQYRNTHVRKAPIDSSLALRAYDEIAAGPRVWVSTFRDTDLLGVGHAYSDSFDPNLPGLARVPVAFWSLLSRSMVDHVVCAERDWDPIDVAWAVAHLGGTALAQPTDPVHGSRRCSITGLSVYDMLVALAASED